ncbi:hypothetical protein CEE37_07380 [candidate division LCP-89 bacterium B3_LCP]|uniref:M23ase beta-sheet core domain-containing protein n=1 Tax=candidate division LCP-89 bacterium B3_LCP TaxID=2012998 RepID=A0A532V0V8_UNCL8|nr:MAG: hypothetical protein CEE37_07380 [candidate division LCP-89 bacterium B3_LCP]
MTHQPKGSIIYKIVRLNAIGYKSDCRKASVRLSYAKHSGHRGKWMSIVSFLLFITFLAVIPGRCVKADQAAIHLNEFGHITCTQPVIPEFKSLYESQPYSRLKGDCFVKTSSGLVTFEFGREGRASILRYYTHNHHLQSEHIYQKIINLCLSSDGRYAAFFDGQHLIKINLERGAEQKYPSSHIFTLDTIGQVAYYHSDLNRVIYRNQSFCVTQVPSKLLLFNDNLIVCTRWSVYIFRNGRPEEMYHLAGSYHDAEVIADKLYLVEKTVQDDRFNFVLHEFDADGIHRIIDKRSYQRRPGGMDTHEEIRSPLHYYETSFSSLVKNAYAQIQEWSSLYLHPGVDIFEAPYTEVYSVQDGVVKAILTTGDERYWRIAIDNLAEGAEGYLYAHLGQDSFLHTVGDTVSAGELIGTLFPAWGWAPHCHFARITPSAHQWDGNWWTVNNPLVDITNMTDTIAPVIEYALGSERFAFRTKEGEYLDPLDLHGEVQIIAKCVDYAYSVGFDSRINIWDIQFKIYDPQNPDTAIYTQYSFAQDMPLDHYFSNQYETLVLNTIYSRDQTCFSTNSGNARDFFYILTNSDGDSAITAEDSLEILDTRSFFNGTYLLEVIVQDASMNTTSALAPIFINNDLPPYRKIDAVSPPNEITLLDCYPNPFNPTTVLSFRLSVASLVRLEVFDIYGRNVGAGFAAGTLKGKPAPTPGTWHPPGTHNITFDGTALTSGIYLYRLSTPYFTTSGKLILIK